MSPAASPAPGIALALAYLLLAHAASVLRSTVLAAAALAVLALLVLLAPLRARRAWAWLALAAVLAVAWALSGSRLALLPLLLVPPVLAAWVGWRFARTLRRGQVPVLTRLVAAMERIPLAELPGELQRYSRGLTALWAGVLWAMAALNGLLALVVRPGGVLEGLGIDAGWSVTPAQWSGIANWGIYGLVGGLLLGEYAVRWWRLPRWRMPPAEVARRARALGPAYWRDFLR